MGHSKDHCRHSSSQLERPIGFLVPVPTSIWGYSSLTSEMFTGSTGRHWVWNVLWQNAVYTFQITTEGFLDFWATCILQSALSTMPLFPLVTGYTPGLEHVCQLPKHFSLVFLTLLCSFLPCLSAWCRLHHYTCLKPNDEPFYSRRPTLDPAATAFVTPL